MWKITNYTYNNPSVFFITATFALNPKLTFVEGEHRV